MKNTFELLSNIEDYIHVEVKKLYPEAELPTFETKILNDREMQMIYTSDRRMADFAEGLINGCIEHFEDRGVVLQELLNADGSQVRFKIQLD